MNEAAGPFHDQDRFECRKNLVKELEEQGLLVKVEGYKTSVGHCYRCKTVVEPYLSLQWFVKTKELAQSALKAVKTGQTRIIPEQWQNTYFRWMEDISRLVHLPSNLVGPSDSCLVLRALRGPRRSPSRHYCLSGDHHHLSPLWPQ